MIKEKIVIGYKSTRKRDIINKNKSFNFNKLNNQSRNYFK